VARVVDAARDADAVRRLLDGTLSSLACPSCGQVSEAQVSVVYHDAAGERLVLVLPAGLRHRELEERAALLVDLARCGASMLPRYAVEFATVFGAEALRSALQGPPSPETAPRPVSDSAAAFTGGIEDAVRTVIDESTNRVALAESAPRAPARDEAVERWALSRTPSAFVVDVGLGARGDEVRLLLRAGGRAPTGPLEARVQLHRLPTYPLLVISVLGGGDATAEPHAVFFDAARAEDRQALALLGQAFHLVVDFFDEEYDPVARRELILPLAANARFALTVADELLAQLPPARRSFEAAIAEWRAPGFDRSGRRDPRLGEDSFAALPSPAVVQQALAVVAGWSEPDNEDYLLLVRSFPVDWWRAIRGRVVARAVELGLVLPGALLDVALTEGPHPGRRELVAHLLGAFAELCARPKANDLGADQVAANWRALFILSEAEGVAVDARVAEIARQTPGVRPPSVALKPRRLSEDNVPSLQELVAASGTVAPARAGTGGGRAATGGGRAANEETSRVASPQASEAEPARPAARTSAVRAAVAAPVAAAPKGAHESGDVSEDHPSSHAASHAAGPAAAGPDLTRVGVGELIDLLDDKDLRLGAALELVRRRDPLAVGPVFGAARRMTRGEAVRILPAAIQFGEKAVPHLVDGLRSRKAYLRQGCALALGVMKSGEGIDPLCDLLIGEPTEVWKEVARALGEIGPGALMSLAARLRERDAQDPDARERVAWALAHVAARGGRAPVETLAGGRDPAAAGAARRALELAGAARENDAEVRGRSAKPGSDVTVNRAFSRKFFEAMNGPPRAEPATLDSGAVLLDDDALVEAGPGGEPSEDGAGTPGEDPILEADEAMIEEEDILPT
jgi:hypothetical protein